MALKKSWRVVLKLMDGRLHRRIAAQKRMYMNMNVCSNEHTATAISRRRKKEEEKNPKLQ